MLHEFFEEHQHHLAHRRMEKINAKRDTPQRS
jgi:hypothetical protein